MAGMESQHYKIVLESLSGRRRVDEQTFTSLEILNDRLARLKEASELFDGVELSPAAQELVGKKKAVAV